MEFKEVKLAELLLLIGVSMGVSGIALFLLSFFFDDPFPIAFVFWMFSMILDTAAYSFFQKSLFLWPINSFSVDENPAISKAPARKVIETKKAEDKEEVRGESFESQLLEEIKNGHEKPLPGESEYPSNMDKTQKVVETEEDDLEDSEEDPEDEVDNYLLKQNKHISLRDARSEDYSFQEGLNDEDDS